MRPVIIATTLNQEQRTGLSSGPGSPIFEQCGPHTRIFRAPVRAIAAVRFDEREIYGQVMDIAPGGCLLKTESTIPDGTVINLRVTLIGQTTRSVAEVRGVVCRMCDVDGRRAYGIEFVANDSYERNNLQWLYAQALNA
jgi:hypothetical protein